MPKQIPRVSWSCCMDRAISLKTGQGLRQLPSQEPKCKQMGCRAKNILNTLNAARVVEATELNILAHSETLNLLQGFASIASSCRQACSTGTRSSVGAGKKKPLVVRHNVHSTRRPSKSNNTYTIPIKAHVRYNCALADRTLASSQKIGLLQGVQLPSFWVSMPNW